MLGGTLSKNVSAVGKSLFSPRNVWCDSFRKSAMCWYQRGVFNEKIIRQLFKDNFFIIVIKDHHIINLAKVYKFF